MEEELYLKKVLNKINDALENIRCIILKQGQQIDYLSQFYADEYYSVDEEEVATSHIDISVEEEKLNITRQLEQKLLISQHSPYFARIDFKPDDEDLQKIYIGIMGILDSGDVPLVCDWRAPISSMFYDYSKGRASYVAPLGIIEGDIILKRQYKIKNQNLEYFFDCDLNINDEILQESLSANASEKLKNIVSTIQAEQNKIIRNEDQKNLLVQGYAGSGKTTVALHRVAYLLYRHKNELNSKNIVLISPSDIFSDYISNVLPELGEIAIPQLTFEELAKKYLKTKIEKREIFFERILKSEELKKIVCFKESFDFYENLQIYMKKYARANFCAKDFVFNKKTISKQNIEKLYFENYGEKDIFIRIDWIADYICDELEFDENEKLALKDRITKILYSYIKTTNIFEIYNDFLVAVGLQSKSFEILENDDLAPLMFINGYIFGFDVQKETKHLVVDEMQDYSPLQFALLNKIYPCPKTIVGDIYQSLYKNFEDDYLEKLSALIEDCKVLYLNKTYRCTKQINDFAFALLPNCDVKPYNREGEEVDICVYNQSNFKQNLKDKLTQISQQYNKVAIITKTKEMSKSIFCVIDDERLSFDENSLMGIPILSIAECRGLEFDAVITVLDNPLSKMQKHILFVGTTRALHKLVVMAQE